MNKEKIKPKIDDLVDKLKNFKFIEGIDRIKSKEETSSTLGEVECIFAFAKLIQP